CFRIVTISSADLHILMIFTCDKSRGEVLILSHHSRGGLHERWIAAAWPTFVSQGCPGDSAAPDRRPVAPETRTRAGSGARLLPRHDDGRIFAAQRRGRADRGDPDRR